jgi:hypothetical protein
MPVMTSTSAADVEAMTVSLKATACTGADVMITQKIAVHLPNRRALGSSARPFVGPSFRSDFAPRRLSPSITARPNLNFGSLIFAWLVSWTGPPMTASSSDSFPYSYWIPLERGSRTSCLDRSTTRTTW